MRAPALQRQIHQNRTASHADLELVSGSVPQPGTGCPGTALSRLWNHDRLVRCDTPTNLMAMGPGGYHFGAH